LQHLCIGLEESPALHQLIDSIPTIWRRLILRCIVPKTKNTGTSKLSKNEPST
jgi:hypothetical protein